MRKIAAGVEKARESFARLLSDRTCRIIFLTAAIVVVIAGAIGLRNLQTTPDNRIFYGDDNPYFQGLIRFEDTFSANDNIVIVLHENASDIVGLLAATDWITTESWRVRSTIRVDSLTNFSIPIGSDGSIELAPLVERECSNDSGCTPKFREALETHRLTGRLISADHRTTAIILTLSFPRGSPAAIFDIMNDLSQLRADFDRKFPQLELRVTGGAPMMAAFSEASAKDLNRILPFSIAALLLTLILTFGSLKLGLTVAWIGLATAVSTLGLFSHAGLVLNSATTVAPLVIFALVIAPAIHLTSRYEYLYRLNPGRSRSQTASDATAATFIPISISVLTSAAGLYSLSFADSPPLRELGLICGTGILIGGVFIITCLPILLSNIRPRRLQYSPPSWLYKQARRLAIFSVRSRMFFCAVCALFLALAAGTARISVNDDFVRFFPVGNEFREETDRITQLLFSPHHLEVVITATETNTILDPGAFQHLSQIEASIREMKNVASVYGLATLLDPVRAAISDKLSLSEMTQEELSQLFLIYELSLPQGQTNTEFLSADHRATRVSVFLDDVSTGDIKQLQKKIEALDILPIENYSLTVTGESIPVAHLTSTNIGSMLKGIIGSMFGIALVFYFLQRMRGTSGLLLLSIGIPLLAGFGLWGFIFGDIGIAAVAIISLTLGIIVDDTAHVLSECQDLSGVHSLDEIREKIDNAITITSPGIVATSAVLSIAMGLLAFSGFEVNRTFGIVCSMIIALALVFTLLVLPRLIYLSASINRTIEIKGP
jgi:uncharacterized protein